MRQLTHHRHWRSSVRVVAIGVASVVVGASASWGLGAHPHDTVSRARVLCNGDASTIETAVAYFDAHPPIHCKKSSCTIGFETVSGPGSLKLGDQVTYGRATQAHKLIAAGNLSGWSNDTHFALSLAIHDYPKAAKAGEVLLYVPATSKHPIIFDNQNAKDGCNAI